MFVNPAAVLFTRIIFTRIAVVASAPSWLIAWVGLELNNLRFIPLILRNKNKRESESATKYFLTQALASVLFLVGGLIESSSFYIATGRLLINIALIIKIGGAPFHAWIPSVLEGIVWKSCFLLLTIQKANPLILITIVNKIEGAVMTTILISLIVGAYGGLSQTSIRIILAFSSINHAGWFLSATMLRSYLTLTYFAIYLCLILAVISITNNFNISHINQSVNLINNNATQTVLILGLLRLGGLPPFIGFLPKWLVLQNTIINGRAFLSVVIILIRLVTLYYYLRIAFASFILSKSCHSTKNENRICKIIIISNSLRLGGLLLTFIF